MSIDKDDPRLTQYALGEMSADEAAAFEAELDAEARNEVEAIRAVAAKIPTAAGPGRSGSQIRLSAMKSRCIAIAGWC